MGSGPWWGRSPGAGHGGNPLQYPFSLHFELKDTCFTVWRWFLPVDKEAWRAAVHGVAKNRTRLSTRAHAYTHTHPHTHTYTQSDGPERIYHLVPESGREVCLGGWKVEGRMETAFCPPRAEVAGPRGSGPLTRSLPSSLCGFRQPGKAGSLPILL